MTRGQLLSDCLGQYQGAKHPFVCRLVGYVSGGLASRVTQILRLFSVRMKQKKLEKKRKREREILKNYATAHTATIPVLEFLSWFHPKPFRAPDLLVKGSSGPESDLTKKKKKKLGQLFTCILRRIMTRTTGDNRKRNGTLKLRLTDKMVKG